MIQSVERAFSLLEALEQMDSGAALGDLASATGLKTPTAHNLLQTMAQLGYVAHDPDTRLYAIGERTWALGQRRFLADTLARVARPALERLHAAFNETVILALFKDGRRHTIAQLESDHSLRVGSQVGVDDHVYQTATGRVLLSLLPPGELDAYVASHGLPADAWPGIATLKDLRCELRTIREANFILHDRPVAHVQAAAAPVRLPDPTIAVALGLYYPTVRQPEGGTHRLREQLTEAAQHIEACF